MEYRHRQSGYLGVLVLIWMVAVGGLIVALADGEETSALVLMGVSLFIVTAVVFWFNTLTVTVDGGRVQARFGPGWPKRIIETRNIIGFRQVRNKWYHGWGIRGISGGWMYNVWGLDAVELELANGKKFRIGTDEPADLIAALSAHTALRAG
ncbi:MAG: hypothetical protein QNL12_15680 [Acidimicrobiia bacterium]|nr:hypothetical protein [Acidimicrobiia bacterium]MDX2468754.1 hypothetical protein [Acidimicrobiia bacterium]